MFKTITSTFDANLRLRIFGYIRHALLLIIGLIVFVWSFLPIYHMIMMSLTPIDAPFGGRIWPDDPTLENYRIALTQDDFFLRHFWIQLANSVFIAIATAKKTLLAS